MESCSTNCQAAGRRALRVAVYAAAILVFFSGADAEARAGAVARIAAVKGEVHGRAPGDAEWAPLAVNSLIVADHSIRTRADSQAVISFNDGSVVKLNSLTTMQIRPIADAPEALNVDLSAGEMWARARENGDVRQVTTPQALCGIRGTELNVGVGPTVATLTVVLGAVEFSNEYGAVMVADSQQSTARADSAPTPPRIVDPNRWIEWTVDIEAAGLLFEAPHLAAAPETQAEALARLDPGSADPAVLVEYAGLAMDLGRTRSAADALGRAVGLAPADPAVQNALGRLYLLSGDRGGAAAAFEAALALKPEDSQALRGLAQVALFERDYDRSAAIMARARDDDPLNRVMAGLALMLAGRLRDAEAGFDAALALDPAAFQAHQGLALLHLFLNRLESAESHARRAVDIYPWSAQSAAMLARVFLFQGRRQMASDQARQALELNPDQADALDILGRIAVLDNDLDSALGFALRALAVDETNPFANNALGRVQQLRMKYRAAERYYRRALEIYPDYPQALVDLADMLLEIRRFGAAAELTAAAAARHPDDDRIRGLHGRTLMAAGEFDRARIELLEAVELNPARASHHGHLAVIAIERNDMSAALEAAETAVALDPGFPHYREALGVVYERIGNTEGALAQYREALKYDPRWAGARYRMGLVLAREGRVRGAVAETSMAILQDPRVISFAAYRGDARAAWATSGNFHDSLQAAWVGNYADARLQARVSFINSETRGFRPNDHTDRETGAVYLAWRPDFRSGWFLMADYMVLDQGQPYRVDLETMTTIPGQPDGTFTGLGPNDPDDRIKTDYTRVNLGYRRWLNPDHELMLRHSTTRGRRRLFYENSNLYLAGQWDAPVARLSMENDFRNTYHEYELRGDYDFGDTALAYGFNRVDSHIREHMEVELFDPVTGASWGAQSDYLPNRFRQWSYWAEVQHRAGPDLWVSAGGENARHNLIGGRSVRRGVVNWRLDERSWLHFMVREHVQLNFYPQLMPRQDWAAVEDADSYEPGQESVIYEIDYERRFKDRSFVKIAGFRRELESRDLGQAGFPLQRSTEKKGVRISYERQLGPRLNAYLQYINAEEKITTPGHAHRGNRAADSPADSGTLGLYYLPTSRLSMALRLSMIGARYASDANTARLSRVTLADLSMQYSFDLHANLSFSVANLADRDYHSPAGYPGPRRRFTTLVNLFF